MTKVNDGTESTTITDGALVVTGGAGIGKRLNVGGMTKINDGTESTTTTDGALVVTGGAGIGKRLNVGGMTKVNDGTESSTTTNGALVVIGGAGIGKRLNVGGALNVNGTSTLSGALTVNNTSALNGQVTVKATLPLGEGTYNNYPLRVEGSPQGIAIKLSAPIPNESNNYLTLFNNGGDIKGRIEGQTGLTGIARNIVTAIVTEPGLDDAFDFNQDKNQAPTSSPATLAQYFGSNYAFAALSLTLDFVTDIVRFVVNVIGASGLCVSGDCDDVVWSVIDAIIGGIQLGAYVAMQESNLGIAFESGGADYAEWLPKDNVEETFIFGDVVGVKGGSISKKFKDAERFMVVSRSPVIIGGMPEINKESFFEKIAFMGQVPVKVTGEVHKGDYILPSGNADGMAIAVKPGKMMASDFKRIIGIAWAESDNTKIINYINTAVGINSNDMAGMIEQMQLVMNNMQKALVAVAPTYKPNYYTIGKDVEVNSNSYTTSPTLNEKFRKEIGGMAKYSNLNEAMQVAKNYAVNQGFDLKQYPMLENLLDNPTPENAQKALDHYSKSLAKAQKLMKQFEEYRKQN